MNDLEQEKPTYQRPRARDLGITPGILPPGPLNAITDVAGVLVGQVTLMQGQDIRTGATAVLPHPDNIYQHKVPAGLAVGNGYGKLMGATQIVELGEIETPIVLTNTLAVPRAAEAILDWTLSYPGNEAVLSANPVVGETNDGYLNDIRQRTLTPGIIGTALSLADSGPVAEGSTGAGAGTTAFGWKGGIGTSSRRLPDHLGGYTLGVLVQSNYDGVLQILGTPIGKILGMYYLKEALEGEAPARMDEAGSIMIILAIDAPVSDRNLTRLARRALGGLARTGASLSNRSGDYAIAFSSAPGVRRSHHTSGAIPTIPDLPNQRLSPLFQAAIESTQEAIYNSLFKATPVTGYRGRSAPALPIGKVMDHLNRSRR
jgi:D-aminopeptidase